MPGPYGEDEGDDGYQVEEVEHASSYGDDAPSTVKSMSPARRGSSRTNMEDARIDLLGGATRRSIASVQREELSYVDGNSLSAAVGGEGGVIIPSHEVHNCLDIIASAMDYCSSRGQTDLTAQLRKVSHILLGENTPDEVPVLSEGFSLGDEVEVRYMLDDDVKWDPCVIAKGSGGGTYTIEFENGEIWDHVPRADLRRPFQEDTPDFAVTTGADGEKRLRSWDLATREERLMYNGWVTLTTSGLVSRRQSQYWGMVIGTKFYYGERPDMEAWDHVDLFRAKLTVLHEKEDEEEEGGRWVLRLVKMPDDDLEMEFLCAYEFRAWKAHIETAILRAERKPDYTAIVGIENTLSNLISRSLLPLFEPEQIIEKNHLAVLSGCVVCSQGSTWWGSHDWKRRWVVLHQNFMCIRPDKAFPQRNLVIPLREVKCWSNPIHNHPNTLEVTGPFIGSKMFCFDDEEGCNKWKMAITSAIFASNPEDATTDKIHQTATDKRGIV